jgi:hypothetical protein
VWVCSASVVHITLVGTPAYQGRHPVENTSIATA